MTGPGEHELRRALREQGRESRFGPDARCELCGDSTLVHLQRIRDRVLCACCGAVSKRLQIMEEHHLAGFGEGPTFRLCANCHGELSEAQRQWLDRALPFLKRLERGLDDFERIAREKGRRI